MNVTILTAITILSLIIAVIALVSRHHLRIRHQQAKQMLNRVARESDELRWQSLERPVE
jgi:hypothetical protein